MPARERLNTIDTERIRALAPVLSASALRRWFRHLDPADGADARQRPVFDRAGVLLGRASLRGYPGTVLRYTNTVSVRFQPAGSDTLVTVRGRERDLNTQTPEGRQPWPPEMLDLDYLGGDEGEGFPIAWRRQNAVTADLLAVGARLRTTSSPAIATIQQETPISIAQAEQALLEFGGVLLNAADIGQQGVLFTQSGLSQADA